MRHLRWRLADILRSLAQRLDGVEVIDARWHYTTVSSVNAYVRRTEERVAKLEEALTKLEAPGAVYEPPSVSP